MVTIEKIWELGSIHPESTEENPLGQVETHVLYTDGTRWVWKGFIADAVNELIKLATNKTD